MDPHWRHRDVLLKILRTLQTSAPGKVALLLLPLVQKAFPFRRNLTNQYE